MGKWLVVRELSARGIGWGAVEDGVGKEDRIGGAGSLQSKEIFLSLCDYGKRFYRD